MMYFDKILLNIVHKYPMDNNSALLKVMAWHPVDDSLLPEPMLTKYYNAI